MSIIEKFHNLSLTRFLEEIENLNLSWIVKRLSGNDTGLTGSHQVGLYLPRVFIKKAIPEINTNEHYNPKVWIDECYFPAQNDSVKQLRAVYYNSKFFPERNLKKKYNEFRLTRWGGSRSPVQNEENTGSILILAVEREEGKLFALAWVASSVEEEFLIEDWLGREVEPGKFISSCETEQQREIGFPESWLIKLPTGKEIFSYVVQQFPRNIWTHSIDKLLLKRREFEFELFEKIENAYVLPKIINGFTSVDSFIKYAHSVSNRRKSRTGTSLELNLEHIFLDEQIAFETQVITENHKKPDFIFPSGRAYRAPNFPAQNLHMMAAKTCCKDRWRQILNEADKISRKHLFTLQQGVSTNQLQEMMDNNIQLVVPEPYISFFPGDWRVSLMTLNGFVRYIKEEQVQIPGLDGG